jgi:phosphoribosylanthranilate isomerase
MSARRTIVVKVCGLTRIEDARAAMDAGADWLGFIVRGSSPRAIDPPRAGEILAALPGATGVAVMVGVGPDEALELARRAGAGRVQLHRVDPAAWPADFPLPAAFVVPVGADGRLAGPPPARHLLMLDTADAARDGGTGRTFPWAEARALCAGRQVMLAGGLDGGNVTAALDAVRAFGVDASSRLESAPGIKDAERVRRYVAAVRNWERTPAPEEP